jgi:capsular exopolysaccharide synthesis family protein
MTANPLTPPSTVVSVQAPAASASSRFTPLDPIRVLQQYAWFLAGVLIVSLILGGILFVFFKTTSPQYTTEAQLLVSGTLNSAYEEPSVGGSLRQQRLDVLSAFIKNQVIMIKSDEVIDAAMKKAIVQDTSWNDKYKSNPQATRESVKSQLSVAQIVGSTLIQLKLTGSNARDLQPMLNAIVEAHLDSYETAKRLNSSDVRKVFVEEQKKAEDEFLQIQQQLKLFREEHDLATLESANNEANLTYNQLAQQASTIAVKLQTSREIYRSLKSAHEEGRIAIGPDELAKVESDPAIATRDERIRGLRETLDVYRHRFGPEHRAVLELERTIEAILVERKSEVDNLLRERQAVALDQAQKAVAAFEGQLAGMEPALQEARAKLRDLTEKMAEYHLIADKATSAAARRSKAQKLLDDIQVKNSRPDNRGVEPSLAATSPRLTFPTVSGIVVTVVILCEGLALVFIFVKELLDQRIKSPTDVMLIPHTKVLGVIPDSEYDDEIGGNMENLVQRDPTGLVAESFRQVRTAILSAVQGSGQRVFMIAGPQPDSGVSSIVNNLALSLAHDNRKVLVIDANFRRPSLHKMFGAMGSAGLAEVLRGTSTLDNAIVHMVDPTVDVLTAGSSASAAPELFESRIFTQMLDECRQRYDVILIDTPPALITSEAQILSKHVDGIAIVVRAARDQRGMVARMVRQLDSSNAVMLGVILNAVRTTAGGYFSKNFKMFRKYRRGANGSLDLEHDFHTEEVSRTVGEKKKPEGRFDSLRDDDDNDDNLGLPK